MNNKKPTITNIGNIHDGIPKTEGIKLGIFDNKDNFYGYKSDTFWSLDKDSYKEHSYESEKRLIDNFLYVLNPKTKSEEPEHTAKIVADTISDFQNKYELADLIKENEIYIKSFDLRNGEVIKTIKLIKTGGAWEIQSS